MSNKTQLQANNNELDALIARVNAAKNTAASLPEAGSGGEDVTAETNEYTTLNAELEEVINSLPEADSGDSSGSIKTCAVTIKAMGVLCDPIVHYVTIEDEKPSITSAYGSGTASEGVSVVMQNVMCESMIYIEENSWMLPNGFNIEGTAKVYENSSSQAFILAPTVEDENCIITFNDEVEEDAPWA